jgi:dTDP-4-amino-4,6-dideoxygalactose transaminase
LELPEIAPDCTHVFHLFVVQLDNRNQFRKYMESKGVSTDVHYPVPPYLSKPYEHLGYTRKDFPVTEYHYSRIVSIPIFTGMANDEQDIVINAINHYGLD